MLVERERISRTWLHKVLIALGVFMLLWPAATTNLFGDGLTGYEPGAPAPRASLSDWFEGDFQKAADQWWKERFGLRFFFVRLENQIDYWLYPGAPSGSEQIVRGKGGWLYEQVYVDGYCRLREPSDEGLVRETLAGVRAIQDALDARGVPFVFLVEPSKAAVYPQWIPDAFCAPHDAAGYDYEIYRPLLDEYGIRYVDGYAVTRAAMPLWPEITLFARGGTHWSALGAYYTANALLDVIRPLASAPIPPIELGEVVIDDDPSGFDHDLVSFQNLLFPDTDYPAAHPQLSMERVGGRGVRLALVGTSFFDQLSAILAQSGGFDRVDHYWYYHHHVYDAVSRQKTPLEREAVDWEGGILRADAVVLDMNMLSFEGEHIRRFVEDGLAHLASAPAGDAGP